MSGRTKCLVSISVYLVALRCGIFRSTQNTFSAKDFFGAVAFSALCWSVRAVCSLVRSVLYHRRLRACSSQLFTDTHLIRQKSHTHSPHTPTHTLYTPFRTSKFLPHKSTTHAKLEVHRNGFSVRTYQVSEINLCVPRGPSLWYISQHTKHLFCSAPNTKPLPFTLGDQ